MVTQGHHFPLRCHEHHEVRLAMLHHRGNGKDGPLLVLPGFGHDLQEGVWREGHQRELGGCALQVGRVLEDFDRRAPLVPCRAASKLFEDIVFGIGLEALLSGINREGELLMVVEFEFRGNRGFWRLGSCLFDAVSQRELTLREHREQWPVLLLAILGSPGTLCNAECQTYAEHADGKQSQKILLPVHLSLSLCESPPIHSIVPSVTHGEHGQALHAVGDTGDVDAGSTMRKVLPWLSSLSSSMRPPWI